MAVATTDLPYQYQETSQKLHRHGTKSRNRVYKMAIGTSKPLTYHCAQEEIIEILLLLRRAPSSAPFVPETLAWAGDYGSNLTKDDSLDHNIPSETTPSKKDSSSELDEEE
eukprot:CAMPEP_0173383428 /NCGR_PEP_ID=MMETSP1356-20130122/6009_1 /TAXON_ID=77927 ORGANISM="Hemiselmis virescens, Strain PCC157" /NCGR_SAMPLE_ID=MMETSP1356 /ASSEMBLY_ACC=CAM_ASM_000847 /LENGTH=110 /DNA_ID=CAMNT_0014338301 /DNA_START=108 /DNA_END=441 /DNA_ORIENTATION=+